VKSQQERSYTAEANLQASLWLLQRKRAEEGNENIASGKVSTTDLPVQSGIVGQLDWWESLLYQPSLAVQIHVCRESGYGTN